jgi:hypothetical protein
MPEKQKRIGRPPKKPKPGTRVSLGLKVTPRIKARLDAVARASGRTQSQEAERLLEQAFSEEDAFGGPELRQIVYLMASSFALNGNASASGKPPKEWLRDPGHYGTAVMAVVDALLIGRPDNFKRQVIDMLGAKLAHGFPSQEIKNERQH